jgi:hypothetical protein
MIKFFLGSRVSNCFGLAVDNGEEAGPIRAVTST